MKYMIEFELPDNDTVLREIKTADVAWGVWGYQGHAKAKPVQRWIPCSERLPGKDESFYVLCCDKYGEIMIGNVFECYDGETPYSAESEHEYMYDCVAWMPLPTPYREGGQDGV